MIYIRKYTAILIFISLTISLAWMYNRIIKTQEEVTQKLINNTVSITQEKLNAFFNPVKHSIFAQKQQIKQSFFDTFNDQKLVQFFTPVIQQFPQISSVGYYIEGGHEFDILPVDSNIWDTRNVYVDRYGKIEFWKKWKLENDQFKLINQWEDTLKVDPRVRPWYKKIINKSQDSHIAWTKPYRYITNHKIGMTSSIKWKQNNQLNILAYDITLDDLSKFTSEYKISENGFIFLMDRNFQMIGLPKHRQVRVKNINNCMLLTKANQIKIPLLKTLFKQWKIKGTTAKTFSFNSEMHDKTWCKIIKYQLNEEEYIYLGLTVPESDLITDLQQTKTIIFLGFCFIILLAIIMLMINRTINLNNLSLSQKNKEITSQKKLIEVKNKEILDSINYAKKIQETTLPSNAKLSEHLKDGFVLYIPKDILSGDFYWLETYKGKIYCAVADSTGHGIPGAMLSVVCSNALSIALLEENIGDTGKLLDRTREIIKERFKDNQDTFRVGMDISLCAIEGQTIQWSGAFNPLWIIRVGQKNIEEIKPNKQPIANSVSSAPFVSHTIMLEKGDQIYLFTDGFADQFGGEQQKKLKTIEFKRLLLSICHLSMDNQKIELDNFFHKWKGSQEQTDDVCVIGIKF